MNGDLLKIALDGLSREYLKIIAIDNKDLLSNTLRALNEKISNNKDILNPKPELIFNAFKLCPWEKLKVVIVGMDPYPKPEDAMGLSFSAPRTRKIPLSLANIYKSLVRSKFITSTPKHPDLTNWAAQGVLLLNASLTTEKAKSGVHLGIWKQYTSKLLLDLSREMASNGRKLVVMLWGNDAQEFAKVLSVGSTNVNTANVNTTKVDTTKVDTIKVEKPEILTWGHPSPLSGFNKSDTNPKNFIYCDNFAKCNEILRNANLEPINWDPDYNSNLAPNVIPAPNNNHAEFAEVKECDFVTPQQADVNQKITVTLPADTLYIATDGGSIGNGKSNCVASWGYIAIDSAVAENIINKHNEMFPPVKNLKKMEKRYDIDLTNKIKMSTGGGLIKSSESNGVLDQVETKVENENKVEIKVESANKVEIKVESANKIETKVELETKLETANNQIEKNGPIAFNSPNVKIVPKATNNIGELNAIDNALNDPNIGMYKNIVLLGDSEYCLKTVDIYCRKWLKDPVGTKMSEKKNIELVMQIKNKLDELRKTHNVTLVHIHSHKDPPVINSADSAVQWFHWFLNFQADRLCNEVLSEHRKKLK